MWKNLSKHWQEAILMSWDAYKHDTIPIGAIVVNKEGQIVSRGKNRIFDTKSDHPMAGSYMAHAEMTAMLPLKEELHPEIRSYKLYTTMEPCPMCFGTMMMMHIKHLEFGAWDKFAGSLELKNKSDYLKGKQFQVVQAHDAVQQFQITLQTAFEWVRNHDRMDAVLDKWKLDYPKSVALGETLHKEGYFEKAIENKRDFEDIFNEVIERHEF